MTFIGPDILTDLFTGFVSIPYRFEDLVGTVRPDRLHPADSATSTLRTFEPGLRKLHTLLVTVARAGVPSTPGTECQPRLILRAYSRGASVNVLASTGSIAASSLLTAMDTVKAIDDDHFHRIAVAMTVYLRAKIAEVAERPDVGGSIREVSCTQFFVCPCSESGFVASPAVTGAGAGAGATMHTSPK